MSITEGASNQYRQECSPTLIKSNTIPVPNKPRGSQLWWCLVNPWYKEYTPKTRATPIIKYSKGGFSMILTPNKGKVVMNSGNTAQCIAQATEAVIPQASQLIFIRISLQK